MADLPDTLVDLPNTMVDLPKTMVDLPKTMVELPNTMVDLPSTVVYSSLFLKFYTRSLALITLALFSYWDRNQGF